MFNKQVVLVLALLTVFSGIAIAQDTPSDIRYLVGERAAAGESGLRRAGFNFVRTVQGSDRVWSYWWADNRNLCISVTTTNGRYASIVTTNASNCNRSSGPSPINPPSWARGTWYGKSPRGEQIRLIVNPNGSVEAYVNDSMSTGVFSRGNFLNIGGASSSVTRNGSGITTTRNDNGERINYGRNTWNTDGPIWGGSGGGKIQPPSWAQGTFYAFGPRGERIRLIINPNGSVEAYVNDSLTEGIYTQGNFISLGSASSSVTRNGNGIATTRTDTRERIEYSRNQWSGGNNGGGSKVNVSDLVGVRASSGEAAMRSRGFRLVDTINSTNSSYTIWWRSRSTQCIQVATANGRYDSLTELTSHPRCN